MTVYDLLEKQQVGYTLYTQDAIQSRLWGHLDHAIQDQTGFEIIHRQWINQDINTIMRFYSDGGEHHTFEPDTQAAVCRYDNLPVKTIQPGHLVVKNFITGPALLTVWRGDNVISTLSDLKGATHPAQADAGAIRGRFWCDNAVLNLIHVSDNESEAIREFDAIHASSILQQPADGFPERLMPPNTDPTAHVNHSGIFTVLKVMRRMAMCEYNSPPLRIFLPESGDVQETHQRVHNALIDLCRTTRRDDISTFINNYLAGNLVAVTENLRNLPVTRWEKFVIQCGAITRETWNNSCIYETQRHDNGAIKAS